MSFTSHKESNALGPKKTSNGQSNSNKTASANEAAKQH